MTVIKHLLDEENGNVDHALEERYRIDSDYEGFPSIPPLKWPA